MDGRWARRVGIVAGLAATVVTAAACGPAPVAPLPGQRPATATPHTVPPSPSESPAAAPTRPAVRPPPARPPVVPPPPPASPSPGLSPACLGPVIYPVDAMAGDLPGSICLAVGAVLRVQNVEAGTVSAEPAEKASLRYEAGVTDCRLLSVGTVTVTIAGDPSRSIAVVVVE